MKETNNSFKEELISEAHNRTEIKLSIIYKINNQMIAEKLYAKKSILKYYNLTEYIMFIFDKELCLSKRTKLLKERLCSVG